MKKSKVFMTAGALLLAVTAIFATKASKRFNTSVKTAHAGTSGYYIQLSAVNVPFTMVTTASNPNGLNQLLFNVNGTNISGLYTASSTSSAECYN
jgi:hypothetical protein